MQKLTVGSLFAGIGGLELGLEMTGGFKTVWQVEYDEYAQKVLEKHWPNVRRWGDVATFPPNAKSSDAGQSKVTTANETARKDETEGRLGLRPEFTGCDSTESNWHVDLICGGFPCQPVSSAGKQRGEDDERWLWDEMRRVCEVLRPTWVLAENVPGLLSAKDVHGKRGALFGRVVRDLASLGYRVRWDCVPAAAVGAPHIRDRVFILAHAGLPEPSGRDETPQGQQCGGRGPSRSKPPSCGDVPDRYDPNAICRNCGHRYDYCTCILPGPFVSPDVPDAAGGRTPAAEQSGRVCGTEQGSEDVADTKSTEPQGIGTESGRRQSGLADESWWSTEPDVGRVAHGIPARVDRLRCLGNAVVPQVAQYIGQRILEAEAEGG